MMNNNNLEEYLTYYLGLESPQYAVMIKGPWGCGKTFFVKNFLLKNKDEEIGDDTVINLKPIYISLYGMTTLENLREAIRAELNPLLYSKVAKFGKEVLKGLLKTTLRIDLDRNGDAKTDGAITGNIDTSAILTLVESDVSGTKALFLDDLERTNIDLEELFGFINNLVEHHSCKVILLADENRLIGKHKEYTKTKEKLVGPTFEIRRDIECIFKIFLEDAVKIDEKYKDIKKYLEENKEQIIEIYKTSQCENLRVFRWSIVDFFHFAKKFHYQLISKNENGKKYGAFMNYITSRQKAGTYMHRALALKFAAWLSPDFEVWVYATIERILFGKHVERDNSFEATLRLMNEKEELEVKVEKTVKDFERYLEIERLLKQEKSKRAMLTRETVSGMKDMFY